MFDHIAKELFNFLLQSTPVLAQVINNMALPFQENIISHAAKHLGINESEIEEIESRVKTNRSLTDSLRKVEENVINHCIEQLANVFHIKLH